MLDFHKRGVRDLLEQDQKVGAWGVKYAVLFANRGTEQQMPKPQDTEENLSIVNQMRAKSDEFVKILNTVYNQTVNDKYTSTAINYGEAVKSWNEMVGLLSFKTNNDFTKQKLEAIIMNGENILKEIIYRYQNFLNTYELKDNVIGASLAYSAYKVIYNKMRTKNLTPITQNEISANLIKELNTDLSAMQNKKELLMRFQSNDVELLNNAFERYEEEHGRKPTEAEKEMIKKNLILSGNLRHIINEPVYGNMMDTSVKRKKQELENEKQKYMQMVNDKEAEITHLEGVLKRTEKAKKIEGKEAEIEKIKDEIEKLKDEIKRDKRLLEGNGKAKAKRVLKKQITQQHAGNEIAYDPEKQSFFK